MSLPWLKGAISGPIRAYGLTVTAAHFSDDRRLGEGGVEERGEQSRWWGPCCAVCAKCMRRFAVDSTAGD